MTDQAEPQGDGPLTREDAVAMLVAAEAPEPEIKTPEAPQEAAPADEETEGEASAPEGAKGEAENPPEDTEAEADDTEAVAPVEPPKYWSQEAKAKFAELPTDLQAVVLAQEGPREEAAAKAKAEAAEARKQAAQEVEGLRAFADQIGQFLPKAVETFKSKWDDIDWDAWIDQDPQAAMRGKLQMEAEQAELQRVARVKEQSDQVARQAFLREQGDLLKEKAPELFESPDKRKALGEYLVSQGIPSDNLGDIGAVEMTIAHKAMLWDQAQAQAKAKTTVVPLKPKTQPAKTVAPVAAPARVNSQQREVDRLSNRFNQTKSREDAHALLMAKGL
ncbi:hypothetical protein [Caulobacter segnis]